MTYVIYDLETTGLDKSFDQIVQFAAVLTDANFNIVERFEMKSRLMPHVLPSAEAMYLTGATYSSLAAFDRASYYDMISVIWRKLASWTPTVFLGFNSIHFDEEFLRFAFYQNLFYPYLTSSRRNTRADVLKLARAIAFLQPGALATPIVDAAPSFKLANLCAANGYELAGNHEAMADVEATLWLVQRLQEQAPDLWSQFIRFATKAAAIDFMRDETAFAVVDPRGYGNDIHFVTCVGRNPNDQNVHYCVDLTAEIEAFRVLSANELAVRLKADNGLIRRVKVNKSPLLLPLYELGGIADVLNEAECCRRAELIRSDQGFVDRLISGATAAEREFPRSGYVEQQLYGFALPSNADERLMEAFHEASWLDRLEIARRFQDRRFAQLARRLIFFERPDLLALPTRTMMTDSVTRRQSPAEGESLPWLTADRALEEVELIRRRFSLDASYFSDFVAHLQAIRTKSAKIMRA